MNTIEIMERITRTGLINTYNWAGQLVLQGHLRGDNAANSLNPQMAPIFDVRAGLFDESSIRLVGARWL